MGSNMDYTFLYDWNYLNSIAEVTRAATSLLGVVLDNTRVQQRAIDFDEHVMGFLAAVKRDGPLTREAFLRRAEAVRNIRNRSCDEINSTWNTHIDELRKGNLPLYEDLANQLFPLVERRVKKVVVGVINRDEVICEVTNEVTMKFSRRTYLNAEEWWMTGNRTNGNSWQGKLFAKKSLMKEIERAKERMLSSEEAIGLLADEKDGGAFVHNLAQKPLLNPGTRMENEEIAKREIAELKPDLNSEHLSLVEQMLESLRSEVPEPMKATKAQLKELQELFRNRESQQK